VTLVFAAMMAVLLAATGTFLYLRLDSSLNASINQHLRSRVHSLVAEIQVGDAGLGEAARSVLNGRPDAFAQVLMPSGHLFDRKAQPSVRPALNPTEIRAALQRELRVDHSGLPGHKGQPVRLLTRPFLFERRPLIAVVGDSLRSRDNALSHLLSLALIGGPVALVLASLAAYVTVGAALRPVEAMRRRAAEVSAAGSDQRLPVPPAGDELHRLGATLNQMLDRLGASLNRERAFVDDASHELRTPLALHKAELELALRYATTKDELRAAVASGVKDVDRLSELAENLLVLARADQDQLALAPQPVPVSELFSTVRERFSGRAAELGREISVEEDAADVSVRADPMRVERALSNLLDNALHYGGGPVRMWTNQVDGRVELHVSDNGPGFPADFLPHAFERFRQADAARSGDGTGLGLAIVDAVARAHGGRAARGSPAGESAPLRDERDHLDPRWDSRRRGPGRGAVHPAWGGSARR
jgi:signal transduction histidine kinase